MRVRHSTPHKKFFGILALLSVLTLTAVARPALANSATGLLTSVEFNANNPSWPQILLQLNGATGTTYIAQQPTPGACPSFPVLSADSMKALLSVAEAAFLAGKTVTIYYNLCIVYDYIYDIQMTK